MWGTLVALALLPALVRSYASTDSIMDADLAQSGYLSNHPMDPNVVGGSSFGILWKQQMTDSKEQWFAKPLVYTQNGGSEMLITASNENNVRIHDAKTGTLITSRTLHPPFLQSDIGCNDVPDYIGVMGTPIIDPATDIIYMFAKGYKNGAASGGVANGEYKLHALQLPALTDAPGFPVIIDGHRADNDPAKYFIGGTIMQRPALTSLNGVIVGAFGGHCDLFNFTGMIVSVSKTPNVGVVSIYAMEQAPGAPSPNPTDITSEKGGKAGIWQSGMGLATDGNRIFVTTGNGQGHANGDVPASGRLPLTTLDECIANFAVSSTGVFSLTDYFEPYDYVQMDAQDKDLGSSGTALLDATTFRTSTINRMAVTVGKNGKVYITNADNLGGFKQGSGGTDNIIQTITAGNSVFGGAGSYPLEGGYIYFTPVGLPTYAYKFGTDSSGAPFFTLAGKTATNSAGRAGVGQPTVTSYNGIAGTGILWVTDVNSGLLAFKAVPNSAGVLEAITLPATPGINKYQRPVFGSGKVFVTASNKIYCLGYPVNLPLNCTTPVDFGSVQTGDTKTATISCKANIAITKVKGCVTSDALFQCSNSSLPQGALAAGATFTFPVTWNLTEKSIEDAEGTSYAKVLPGVESGVLSLITTNGVTGYTDTTPLSLTGTVVSADPYLWMNPSEVDFGGLVLGSDDAAAGLTGSASIANIGSRALTFTGMAWQLGTDTTGEWHNLTFTDEGAVFGLGFTSSSFPKPGSQLAAGETIAVPLLFNSTTIGTYSLNLMLWSDGGQDSILLAASVGNPPIATIAVSTLEGGWDYSEPTHMAFGNVLAGQTVIKKIQICNVGGSVLTITKSKPPSSAQLTAVSPYGELLEGQKIDVGACANGSVAVYAAPIQPNHPSQYISLVWVLNTDGLSNLDRSQPFGVHEVQTDVTIVSAQIGPLLANGTARYQWVGCFADTNGRNLQTQINTAAQQTTNSNDQCQTLCMNAGYAIAGTEYSKECWCGNAIKQPSSLTPDSANHCTFSCTGNNTQSCGGDGGYLSMYADITKFDIAAFLAGTSSSTTKTTTTMLATGTATGSTTTTTAATSTSTGSPLNPNEPAVVNGQWNYIGCYKDNVNNVRSLSTKNTAADTMTLESCATYCSAYNFFGTEYGRECYCGYTLDTTLRATESDCSTKCAANSAELCGAGSRLSVYNNTVYNAPPPSPSHVARSGNYAWLGCYTEATTGRALAVANYASDSMTVDTCAAFCAGKGTQYMGVEYGRECYCGNTLGTGVNLTSTSDCSTLCKNNTLQYCGAGSRLDLYTYSLQTSTSSSVLSTSSTVSSSSMSSSMLVSSSSSLVLSSSSLSSSSLVGSTSSSVVSSSSSSSLISSSLSSIITSTSSSSLAVTSSTSSLLASSSTDIPTSTSSSSSSLLSSSSSSVVSSSTSTLSSSSSSLSSSSSSTSSSSSSIASSSSSSSSVLSSSSSTSSSTSSSLSSSSSSSSSSSLLSSSSTSTGPASTSASPTSSSSSSSSSSTSTGPTATATNGYYHLGCYSDTSSGHALPQLFANNSVTPELCLAYAKSLYDNSPTPTTQMPYVYVEYHHECYGGSSLNFQGSAVTSLIGTKACTDYCYGSVSTFTTNGVVSVTTGKANMCGGAKQFNLYALTTPIAFPTTGGPVTTKSA